MSTKPKTKKKRALEPINGTALQSHLAKKRKQQEKKVVRPGCKPCKLSRQDETIVKSEEDLKDLRLLNFPSIEKVITPLVSTVTSEEEQKSVLVVDFNRPPYMDSRFRFVGYTMVFIYRAVKHLATSLSMAANVLTNVVPIFFDSQGIRIKKCEYDEHTQEGFIFQVRFHHLLQYYCHVPMGFLIDSKEAHKFAKHHMNQSGECSVIWKFHRDDQIRVHVLNDDKNIYKSYLINMMPNFDPILPTPPLRDNELSWDMDLELLSRSCDELNLSNLKDPSMTFRVWGNAIELFSENEKNFHVYGMDLEVKPVRQNLQFSFRISLNCLRKVCSRMKKSKGQEKTLTISVDANPESFVQFSQQLSDQITFEWWLSKRSDRN